MFIIIWTYIVTEGHEAEFEKIYGAQGDWAQLFKQGPGYLGTKLIRDKNHPRHYITIDRWVSSTAFAFFLDQNRLEYEAMDARCEFLTEHEERIGEGDLVLS